MSEGIGDYHFQSSAGALRVCCVHWYVYGGVNSRVQLGQMGVSVRFQQRSSMPNKWCETVLATLLNVSELTQITKSINGTSQQNAHRCCF